MDYKHLYKLNYTPGIEEEYRIIATGDQNSYLLFNSLLVDVGVPFKKVKPHIDNIDAIVVTHEHQDHINYSTIKKIQSLRPSVVLYIGNYLEKKVKDAGITRYKIVHVNNLYMMGGKEVYLRQAYHNVPNIALTVHNPETGRVIFHATDLGTTEGLSAHHADIVALEFNHDEFLIQEYIEEEMRTQGWSHYMQSQYNHLSFQKGEMFIKEKTKGLENIVLVQLHTSESFVKYLPYSIDRPGYVWYN